MAIPERIPIAYEPDYRTSTMGTYEGGQFFGSVTATLGVHVATARILVAVGAGPAFH